MLELVGVADFVSNTTDHQRPLWNYHRPHFCTFFTIDHSEITTEWHRPLFLHSLVPQTTCNWVHLIPSVLWCRWLGGRKDIESVKNWVAWLRIWVTVQICIRPSWCHCHSLSLAPVNPDWFYRPGFTFLVPAHLHSPGGGKMVAVVVVVVDIVADSRC